MQAAIRPASSAPADTPPIQSARLLRAIFGFDAATCVALGAVLVVANAGASRLIGLPAAMLTETGVFLLVFGTLVAAAVLRRALSRVAFVCIVLANALWGIAGLGCAWLVMSDAPALGRALVVAQAVAVAGLAIVEAWALRRARR